MILDDQILQEIEETRIKYEFMTFLLLKDDIIVGIVQNETPKILMLYQFDLLHSTSEKEQFLQFGDEWWWGSNVSIPINLFIGDRFEMFEYCLRGYARKSIQTLIGPTFNLADRYLRRVKKRRVEILLPKAEL